MKTKQEQIEEVEQNIWDWLQSHYQESCYTTELGKFTNAICDFWKIYNDNKDEIEQLKAKCEEQDNEIDKLECIIKENDERCFDCPQVKQAQIDVLKKLKERAIGYTFLGEKLATETDIDELIKEYEK